ncbi:YigZ family protein [Mitsuokella sp.]|uniref:YigZ family protein n=1 Tax=Mitsuokella TaxID=52225 RepID=UPI002A820FF6|nr:YigZ family protein [Mitsuokella sp.]MDY4474864.1 YigZ family protein [Mitsuokella sp.]
MQTYRTIQEQDDALVTHYEIQKSKFITHLRHVETEEEARAFVQAMKKKYFDARHNCSAWVLGPRGDKQKSNDDGEPGGTAGNPILEAIRKNELTDVVIVVTRYFGGIKLGAGGLIRAYGHAAVLGLDAATHIAMTPFQEVAVTVGYDLLATVEHWLRQQEIRHGESEYGENVTLHLLLPPEEVETRLTELTDLTSANFTAVKGARTCLALPCPKDNKASD